MWQLRFGHFACSSARYTVCVCVCVWATGKIIVLSYPPDSLMLFSWCKNTIFVYRLKQSPLSLTSLTFSIIVPMFRDRIHVNSVTLQWWEVCCCVMSVVTARQLADIFSNISGWMTHPLIHTLALDEIGLPFPLSLFTCVFVVLATTLRQLHDFLCLFSCLYSWLQAGHGHLSFITHTLLYIAV